MLDNSGPSLHVNKTPSSFSRNQIGHSLTVPKLDGMNLPLLMIFIETSVQLILCPLQKRLLLPKRDQM